MRIKVSWPLPVKIVFFLVVIIVGYNVFFAINRKVTVNAVITDESQFHHMVDENVLKYRSEISFETTLNPDTINYMKIFTDIIEKDTYIGSQLYSYRYYYMYKNGRYDVKLSVNKPIFHRVILTEIRAKEIAKALNSKNLTDYEKVKAVHDYLVLTNEYSYSESGAYNAFYLTESACNGYAYAFYVIMKELGIPATCEFGDSHEWNRVMLDGEWYNIDVTWDDAGGQKVRYDYFLKSDKDWIGHHHGGATAKKSIEPTGKSAIENKSLIPDYRLIIAVVACFIGAIILFLSYRIEQRIKNPYY